MEIDQNIETLTDYYIRSLEANFVGLLPSKPTKNYEDIRESLLRRPSHDDDAEEGISCIRTLSDEFFMLLPPRTDCDTILDIAVEWCLANNISDETMSRILARLERHRYIPAGTVRAWNT